MGFIDKIRKISEEARKIHEDHIQAIINEIETYKKEHPYLDGMHLGEKIGNEEAVILREKGYFIGFEINPGPRYGAWCYWDRELTPEEKEEKNKKEEEERIRREKEEKEEGENLFQSIIRSIELRAKDYNNGNYYKTTLFDEMNRYCYSKLIKEGFKILEKTYEDGNDYSGWTTYYEYTISW